jgi:putative transposase
VSDTKLDFTGRALDQWAYSHGVKLHFIEPGKLAKNAYLESFNGKLPVKRLNANYFLNLADARRKVEAWRVEYNTERPPRASAIAVPRSSSQRSKKSKAPITLSAPPSNRVEDGPES